MTMNQSWIQQGNTGRTYIYDVELVCIITTSYIYVRPVLPCWIQLWFIVISCSFLFDLFLLIYTVPCQLLIYFFQGLDFLCWNFVSFCQLFNGAGKLGEYIFFLIFSIVRLYSVLEIFSYIVMDMSDQWNPALVTLMCRSFWRSWYYSAKNFLKPAHVLSYESFLRHIILDSLYSTVDNNML